MGSVLMKRNFKENYLDQEVTIFHLEGDVFHCIPMLNQVLADFWGRGQRIQTFRGPMPQLCPCHSNVLMRKLTFIPRIQCRFKDKQYLKEEKSNVGSVTDEPEVYLIQTGSVSINLVLSDDMRRHLTTPGLQTLEGERLKAHLVTVKGGCLWKVNTELFYSGENRRLRKNKATNHSV